MQHYRISSVAFETLRKVVLSLALGAAVVGSASAGSPGQRALDEGVDLYRRGNFAAASRAFKVATERDAGLLKAWENLALAEMKLGRIDAAEKIWSNLAKLTPDDARVFHVAGDAYSEARYSAQAAAYYERSLSIDKDDGVVNLKAAKSYESLGNKSEAEAHYRGALEDEKTADAAALRLAALYKSDGKIRQAIDTIRRRGSGANGGLRRPLAILFREEGNLLTKKKRLTDAEKAFRTSYRYDPTIAGTATAIADNLIARKKLVEAEKWIASHTSSDPPIRGKLRSLGWAYWKKNDLVATERVWKLYEGLEPRSTMIQKLLLDFCLAQRNYYRALEISERSLRIDGNQTAVRLTRAKVLFALNRHPEARLEADTLAAKFKDDIGIQTFRGDVLMQAGDFAQGKDQWARVLSLGSKLERAREYWILSRYETGERDAAIDEAAKYIRSGNRSLRLLRLLITNSVARNDDLQHEVWLRKTIELFPEEEKVRMELAEKYRLTNRGELAQATLKQALLQNPGSIEARLALAELDLQSQRADRALAEFSTLRNESPLNRRAYLGTINALVQTGDAAGAKRILDEQKTLFLKAYEADLLKARVAGEGGDTREAESLARKIANRTSREIDIPVLLYHGLSTHSFSDSVSSNEFDDQVRSIVKAGYKPITVKQLANMQDGKVPFPLRPILITFDDARRDSFELGSQILARYKVAATMFVPTARIDAKHPFFASWDSISSATKNGLWDIQSHGHSAHDPIVKNADGKHGLFSCDYAWKPDRQRSESETEFTQRLREDFEGSRSRLEARTGERSIIAYAFPFSEAGQDVGGSVVNAAIINERLVKQSYRYSFVQDVSGYNRIGLGETSPLVLSRFAVPKGWSGRQLLAHLEMKNPQYSGKQMLARVLLDEGRSSSAAELLSNAVASGDVRGQLKLASAEYQRGNYSEAQRIAERVVDAKATDNLTSSARELIDRAQWHTSPGVSGNFERRSDSNSDERISSSFRFLYPSKKSEIWVEPSRSWLKQRGGLGLQANEIAIGAAYKLIPELKLSSSFQYRDFDEVDGSVLGGSSLSYRRDGHELLVDFARRDVDTVRSRLADISFNDYLVRYGFSVTDTTNISVGTSYQAYDRGIDRYNIRLFGSHELAPSSFYVTGDVRFSDTDEYTSLFYAPQDLVTYQPGFRFASQLTDETRFELGAGVGGAYDSRAGSRASWRIDSRVTHDFTEDLRGSVDVEYSGVPDYDAFTFGGYVGYHF